MSNNRSSSIDIIDSNIIWDNNNNNNSTSDIQLNELKKDDFEPSLSEANSLDPLQPNDEYDDIIQYIEPKKEYIPITISETIKYSFHELWRAQKLVFHYVWTETQRHRRSFLTGWFTVFLVVVFVSLLLNSVRKSPIVFFKLAENSVGENDLVLSPGMTVDEEIVLQSDVYGLPLVNHSIVNHSMSDVDIISGTTPRWLLIAKVSQIASSISPATAVLLGIDSKQEKHIGYGREWQYNELSRNEVVLSKTIIRQIDMNPETAIGREVNIGLSLNDLLKTFGSNSNLSNSDNSSIITNEVLTLFPELNDIYNTSFTINLNLNSSLFNFTVNNDSNFNVSSVINFIDQLLFPILNATLGYSQNQVRDYVETLNIPGLGNITTLTNEIINSLLPNSSTIQLNVSMAPLLEAVFPLIINEFNFNAIMTVRGIVDQPLGKWPAELGSVAVVDTTTIVKDLKEQLDNLRNFDANFSEIRRQIDALTGFDIVNDVSGLNNNTYDVWKRFWSNDYRIDTNNTIFNTIDELNEHDVAFTSTIQHRDRLKLYIGSLKAMHIALIQLSNAVADHVGIKFPAKYTLPLDTALQESQFLRYFLDNIFGASIALLCILGMMLIYALLLNDVEERTYEYGMLRALGMKQRTLIQLLLTKSMIFAIPGICFGLLISFLFNIPIVQRISAFAVIPTDYSMSSDAILVSLCLGFLMPLIANILPISRALSRTLRDSLDIYHQVVNDIIVRVERLSNLGMDIWQTALGILLVVVGFITYYLIPYSFTFRNFGMFLGILNGILLGMLFGLCLVASILQPYLERFVLFCIVHGSHRRFSSVVRKNLSGHRHRNRKTAQMFTVCLAFVIFAGVMFALQANSLSDNVRVFFGSDILISAVQLSDALDEESMSNYLNQQMELTKQGQGILLGYTFVTFSLRQTMPIRNARMANLPGYPSVRNFVFGVQENYLDVAYDEYYLPTDVVGGKNYPKTSNGKSDAIKIMWTDAGGARLPDEVNSVEIPRHTTSGPVYLYNLPHNDELQKEVNIAYTEYVDVVISEALRNWMSISVQTPLQLKVYYQKPNSDSRLQVSYLCKARGLARKVPGFFFSSYAPTAFFSSVIIKEEHFKRILFRANEWAGTTTEVNSGAPKMRLLIKTHPDATANQREDIINSLRPYFKSDATIALDTQDVIDSVQTAVELLNLFFTVVGVIAMVLCFFILWLSFTANVRENAWEFGVLRAVGLSSFQVVMIYIYEALSLVLASLIMGTTIGILIAVSLTLQFNLFVEMPFRFAFPHTLFWTITFMAISVAVLGSFFPAYSFMKRSVSSVIRHS